MKNSQLAYKSCCLIGLYAFSISEATFRIKENFNGSDQLYFTQALFTSKADTKKEISRRLEQQDLTPEKLSFDGLIIEDEDLSDMHLKGVRFDGCTFINVSFKNSSLLNTTHYGCEFKKVDFSGTIFEGLSDEDLKKFHTALQSEAKHNQLLKKGLTKKFINKQAKHCTIPFEYKDMLLIIKKNILQQENRNYSHLSNIN